MFNTHQKAFARVKPDWDFYGLIDLKGNYVLEPVFKDIHGWKNGMARLEKRAAKIDFGGKCTTYSEGQYGFINSDGNLITDLSFTYAKDFSGQLAGVHKNEKWGFIDTAGQLIIPYAFDNILDFREGLCQVTQDDKWGVIDTNGNWVLKNEYESLSAFNFGLAIAEKKEGMFNRKKLFVIDKQGNKVVTLPEEWAWFKPVSEKLILIGTTSGYPGERFYGFMDLEGKIRSKPQFYTTSDSAFNTGVFTNGKLYVETKDGKKGYVNEEGEFEHSGGVSETSNRTIPTQRPFDEVLEFSEGLAVARKGDLWGVIDENNNVVVEFKFQKRILRTKGDKGLYLSGHLPKYSCGLLGIEEERDESVYAGYIDSKGQVAIDLKFKRTEPFVIPGINS